MILAVPILIAVCLFLGWVLVKLAVNALPLLAGITAGFAILPVTGSIGGAVVTGFFVAIAVSVAGPIAFRHARSGQIRLILALLFAVPAAIAARHAALGITGYVMIAGAGREAIAFVIALVVGGLACQRLTERAASLG